VKLKLAFGVPEVVTVNEFATPAVKVALLPLVMVGGVPTIFKVAVLLVAPVPPSVEVIGPVVLGFMPVVVAVTFTEIVHEPLPATDPADKLIEPEPATAVVVPLQEVLRPFGVATTNPAGKISVKAMPLRLVVFGFEIVNVRLVLVFRLIWAAPNAFEIVGGASTMMLAEAVLPVPPLVELTALVVLSFWPAVVPVTLTLTLQDALAATVPPLRLIDPLPAVAVTVPWQPLETAGGVAITSPAGSESVNASPFSATVFPAGFVIVKVRPVVPFSGIVAAPKVFEIDGGDRTF